jgi:hypothetical protein
VLRSHCGLPVRVGMPLPDESVSVQAVEVVGAELAVLHAIPQDVPRCDQDGVRYRRNRLLVATPASNAMTRRSSKLPSRS